MSRIVVIGATGHVGTYLIPRLVRAGHDVVAISRGTRAPYTPAPEWSAVERVTDDREASGFEERVAALGADAVIDMVCFTPQEAQRLGDGPRPARPAPGHCATISAPGAA